MAFKRPPNLELKGVSLLGGTYKNFTGTKTKFNAAGNRNFCIKLDPESAEMLLDIGWNVKCRPPKEGEEGEPLFYIKCHLRDDSQRPPEVYAVHSKNGVLVKTQILPENWAMFDSMYVESVDILLTPWRPKDADPDDKFGAYTSVLMCHVDMGSAEDFAAMYPDDVSPDDDENPFA